MLAPITHILPVTLIRRERVMQGQGKLLVRKGQKVTATDTIAEVYSQSEHVLVDVARGLAVSVEQADHLIQCKVGDQLGEGDLIAGPLGLVRRTIRSPRAGYVILVGNGQVLLETTTQPYLLKAGLPGDIVELISDRGAIIETTGALIQGVWGNGKVDFGIMSVLAKSPNQELTASQLDVSLRGSVVLAAFCKDPEVLKSADELPLRALILASIAAPLVPIAAKMNTPVIVLEGFGRRPINSVAFRLLTTNERREVVVNAERWDHFTGARPEVVIPLPAPGNVVKPRETVLFTSGQTVHVLRAPHAGEVGILLGLVSAASFPSGLKVPAGEVRLEGGKTTLVPLANLEILA